MIGLIAQGISARLKEEARGDFNQLVQQTTETNEVVPDWEVKKRHPDAALAYNELTRELLSQLQLQPA